MSAPFAPSAYVSPTQPAGFSKDPRAARFQTSGRLRLKRAFDLALLLPTLPVFVPAIAGLALVSKVSEGGPVFFTQERATVGGRPFVIYKLRTMTMEADVSARTPTKIGQWMRQRGIDELPQLINVLRGEMSLVGPRPLLHADIDRLAEGTPLFKARLDVPPGLTGLAQVTMTTGAKKVAALDAHYAKTHSPLGDLKILLRTAWMNVVGKKRGKAAPIDVSAR